MKVCKIDGCERTGKIRRGYCSRHYYSLRTYGDPLHTNFAPRKQTAKERAKWLVENRVEKLPNGCWRWLGKFSDNRYTPTMSWNNRLVNVAGFFRIHLLGVKQTKGTIVCHNCPTSGCVNPNHIRFDTQKSNAIDREVWGTNPHKKLSELDVVSIRAVGKYFSKASLAKAYNVSSTQIRRIMKREKWGWLEKASY